MTTPSSLSGQLLLAMPGIGDPHFERAVIAVCAHDAGGALGIGIGRIVPRLGLHRLLAQLDIAPGIALDVPIHRGGPVEPHRGFVLHSSDWSGEETLEVEGRWGLTGTLDVLRALADGTGPARFVVALGYAGWGGGQLDEEMTRYGWFATPADDALLFEVPVDERWPAAFGTAGVDVRQLVAATGHA